jgi:hypothetical protein
MEKWHKITNVQIFSCVSTRKQCKVAFFGDGIMNYGAINENANTFYFGFSAICGHNCTVSRKHATANFLVGFSHETVNSPIAPTVLIHHPQFRIPSPENR